MIAALLPESRNLTKEIESINAFITDASRKVGVITAKLLSGDDISPEDEAYFRTIEKQNVRQIASALATKVHRLEAKKKHIGTPEEIMWEARHVFNLFVQEGMTVFQKKIDSSLTPVPSHICFKFDSFSAYQDYIEQANQIGAVQYQDHKGKEIAWCKLHEPLEKSGLVLEWLELVEPKTEKNSFNGVTSIGYCVKDLPGDPVKISIDADPDISFRYQSRSVHP